MLNVNREETVETYLEVSARERAVAPVNAGKADDVIEDLWREVLNHVASCR